MDLTEETYEEYCERTRDRFSDEMLESAARRQVRVEAGAKALVVKVFGEDWDTLLSEDRNEYESWVRTILDAADQTTEG